MAISTGFYKKFHLAVLNKEIDWDTDSFSCVIMKDSHSPDFATHDFRNDISGDQATGQTAQAIPTAAISSDASYAYMDCGASATFTGVTAAQSVGGIAVYKDTGNSATDILCLLLAFSGGAFTTNGQSITVNFHANGVGRITFG
jgi:hypothetical protein